MKFLSIAFQVLLLASFAMWFGGFGFYVSFVVPIGNEMFGSFEQGMITRRASVVLNYLGVLAAVLMVIDSGMTWSKNRSRIRYVQISCAVFILLMLAALFVLHPQIDAFVDVDLGEIIGDYDQFYWLHRLYLWASTFQWVAAWIWLVCYLLMPIRTIANAGIEASSPKTNS